MNGKNPCDMTREEAIKILKEIIDEGWLISDFDKCIAIDACEMAIKALEHEPVLNKIRDEIEQIEINGHIRDVECFRAGIDTVLNIINKYKVER